MKKCTKCDKLVYGNVEVCDVCGGTLIEESPEESPYKKSEPAKKSSCLLRIIIYILIICLAKYVGGVMGRKAGERHVEKQNNQSYTYNK